MTPRGVSYRCIETDSGVPTQPLHREEVEAGAYNRAVGALKAVDGEGFNFGVGLQLGVEFVKPYKLDETEVLGRAIGRVCVVSDAGEISTADVPPLPLGGAVMSFVVEVGLELPEALDKVFPGTNVCRTRDAPLVLTAGVLDAKRMYEPAVISAFLPFAHPECFPAEL